MGFDFDQLDEAAKADDEKDREEPEKAAVPDSAVAPEPDARPRTPDRDEKAAAEADKPSSSGPAQAEPVSEQPKIEAPVIDVDEFIEEDGSPKSAGSVPPNPGERVDIGAGSGAADNETVIVESATMTMTREIAGAPGAASNAAGYGAASKIGNVLSAVVGSTMAAGAGLARGMVAGVGAVVKRSKAASTDRRIKSAERAVAAAGVSAEQVGRAFADLEQTSGWKAFSVKISSLAKRRNLSEQDIVREMKRGGSFADLRVQWDDLLVKDEETRTAYSNLEAAIVENNSRWEKAIQAAEEAGGTADEIWNRARVASKQIMEQVNGVPGKEGEGLSDRVRQLLEKLLNLLRTLFRIAPATQTARAGKAP